MAGMSVQLLMVSLRASSGNQSRRRLLQNQQMGWLQDYLIQTAKIFGCHLGIHDHGRKRRTQFDDVGKLLSVHSRQGIFGDDQIVDVRVKQRQGFLAVAGRMHLKTKVIEKPFGGDADASPQSAVLILDGLTAGCAQYFPPIICNC